jgi:hypothetical protein
MASVAEDLNPFEVAILEFTNDASNRDHLDPSLPTLHWPSGSYGEPASVTTKGAYYWATTLAMILQARPELEFPTLADALRKCASKNSKLFQRYYSEIRPPAHEGQVSEELFRRLILDLGMSLKMPDLVPDKIYGVTAEAYYSLRKRGLIEDPIEIAVGTMIFAALGFVPYGFTQKTVKGKVIHKKISAAYWTYEVEDSKGVAKKTLNIRLLDFLRRFKKAFITASEEASEDPEQ